MAIEDKSVMYDGKRSMPGEKARTTEHAKLFSKLTDDYLALFDQRAEQQRKFERTQDEIERIRTEIIRLDAEIEKAQLALRNALGPETKTR